MRIKPPLVVIPLVRKVENFVGGMLKEHLSPDLGIVKIQLTR